MRFTSLLLCTSALQSVQALIDIERNGTVAEHAFVNPILSKGVITGVSNFNTDSVELPAEFQGVINELEASLGAVGTKIDTKSGRVESLTLSQPILPGIGVDNRLLWTVASEADSLHSYPASVEEWEELAIQAVKNWMEDHASELQINVSTELFAAGSVRTAVHGDGDMIQLSIPRIYNSIPVVGARAMATIKLGNLINVGFEDWGTIPDDFDVVPTLTVDDCYQILSKQMELNIISRVDKCNPELQILTLTPSDTEFGQGYEYALAWRICPLFEGQDVEVMEGLINAHTGEVYSFIDKVHYLHAKGGVYPISNDGRTRNNIPDGIEQPGWPMPYMYVGSEVTTTGGNYFATGAVSASLHGPYVILEDRCGTSSLTSEDGLDWGTSGGTDCTTPGIGGSGNTHSARTTFYEVNKIIEIAKSHLPGNAWLKQKLYVKTNRPSTCNAFWVNAINFYRSGGGCGNTGELAGVIVHEWGHGMDDNDVEGSISSPSGEGIADIYAALRMGDSCIGRGFYSSSNRECTGVRNIDYMQGSGKPNTFSNNGCGGAVHCLGGVYSEAIWSLYKRKLQSAPYNFDDNTALEIVTRLTFIAAGNVKTWFSGTAPWGGCGSASGYREYLAADDDNGNLNDGTPHMQAIFDAFNDQEIACNTPARQDSGCAGTPNTAPDVTVTPGDTVAIVSWQSVPGATKYQVFRSEGIKKCGQGKVRLATTTSLQFTDTGLMNGREYFYIVIPKGPNDSCFGPASPCNAVTPSEVPVPTSQSPTKKPSTVAPSLACGNGICDGGEFEFSCYADCGNKELSVVTEATKGAPGAMFFIKSTTRDIGVREFKFLTWTTSVNQVQVYTRPGEFIGFEHDITGWDLIFDDSVQLNGVNNLTELSLPNRGITVQSGTTQSFFIFINQGNMKYDSGSSELALIGADDHVEFYTGVGLTTKFTGSSINLYSPRRFSGIVNYDVLKSQTQRPTTLAPQSTSPTKLPVTPKPTASPSQHPTKKPVTRNPTNHPSVAPTSSPTLQCGSNTCQADETSSTCPQDCSNVIFTAHNKGVKGSKGVMFDLSAKRDLLVKALEHFTSDKRNELIEVYTRPGSYSGFELEGDGWELVYSNIATQMGRNIVTTLKLDEEVAIRGGETQSFFIITNNFIMYDSGAVEGDVLNEDESLTIYEGVGLMEKFPGDGMTGMIYSPRRFRGNIRYDAIRITDSPTAAPITSKPTNTPSKSPTQHPTLMPVSSAPTRLPTKLPVSSAPTNKPTSGPTGLPTMDPTSHPTSTELSCYPRGSTVKIEATTKEQLNMFEVRVFDSSGDNLALSGEASQSSTLSQFVASRAIDGEGSSFSHTQKLHDGTLVWWQVKLSDTFEIASVEVANRFCRDPSDPNGCYCRLTNAKLSLIDDKGSVVESTSFGDTCGQGIVSHSFKSPDCQVPTANTTSPTTSPIVPSSANLPIVKSIRLHSVTGKPISMFEFEIYSNGVNVALGGQASQSSTVNWLNAAVAIDGDKNSFSHTTSNEAFSWWMIELAEAFPVDSVKIVNRYCASPDDPDKCLCRLSYAIVSFVDAAGNVLATASVGDTCNVLEWEWSGINTEDVACTIEQNVDWARAEFTAT